MYIPPWLQKSFTFMVLRLLENKFVSQIESVYSCPQAKLSPRLLSSPLQDKEITHFSQTKCFKNLFFPSREGEDYGAEIMAKLKLARILITKFDKFNSTTCKLYFFWFLFCCAIICVLLCQDSNKLKCKRFFNFFHFH